MVTQQFHETLEPLSEWLGATEKHLINCEPIGTEMSKLEDQISQHKVTSVSFCCHLVHFFSFRLFNFISSHSFLLLRFFSCFCFACVSFLFYATSSWFAPHLCGQALEEEIMNHSKDLFQAVSLGQMLRTVSSVDDKEFVQSKLDAAQAGYIELQERCRRKAEMLQQALANAQLFGEDEVALMNWLSEVHTRLNEVSVEECKVDVLENQLAEQRVHSPPLAKRYVVSSI